LQPSGSVQRSASPRARVAALVIAAAIAAGGPAAARPCAVSEKITGLYRWKRSEPRFEPLACRFPAPAGFRREVAAAGSYAAWLRQLPLRRPGTPVRSHHGRVILAGDHRALAAVVDLDIGRRDRQQCADTIIRLRGEYLFARERAGDARFRWAGGKRFGFAQWARGLRPERQGRRWRFVQAASPSGGYRGFRRYLEYLFIWTGTVHLLEEPRPRRPAAGDFFVQAGAPGPGHAVVILDTAVDDQGRRLALIGQGFMPAQDLHVLRTEAGTPWFRLDQGRGELRTPFWTPFRWSDLRRFRY
jgi:hypothetical protein